MNNWLIHAGLESSNFNIPGVIVTLKTGWAGQHEQKKYEKRKTTKASEIVALFQSGMSEEEITESVDTKYAYVRQVLLKHGNTTKLSKKTATPVLQYDLCGRLIKEHKSAGDAARATGLHENHIRNVCNPNASSHRRAGGFIFKYKGM